MPARTPVEIVASKFSDAQIHSGRPAEVLIAWLSGLKDPREKAEAVVGYVERPGRSPYDWEEKVAAHARKLLGKSAKSAPKVRSVRGAAKVRARTGGGLQEAPPSKTPRGKRGKDKDPTGKRGVEQAGRPRELFPDERPHFFPETKLAQSDVEAGAAGSGGVVVAIPFLEGLPADQGGPAWKRFFKRHKGKNLDDPSHIVEVPGMFPSMLVGERIEGPDGWTAVYRIVDAPAGELALELHAMHHDAYVASWNAVVAPREPLEKDEVALRMVTASAIAGAVRALVAIARRWGVKVPTQPDRYKPTPRNYHKEIATRYAANLRGAPLFAEVQWGRGTAVEPNDDFFGGF